MQVLLITKEMHDYVFVINDFFERFLFPMQIRTQVKITFQQESKHDLHKNDMTLKK